MTSRHVISAVTLAVLLTLLTVGAVVGWRWLTAPPGDAEGPRACAADNRRVVRAAQVTVTVLNSGSRSGLAQHVQEQLVARGFKAGDLGNTPASVAPARRVKVLALTAKDPEARLVARQFGPGTAVRPTEEDLGEGVVVVVGDGYDRLADAPRKLRVRPGERC